MNSTANIKSYRMQSISNIKLQDAFYGQYKELLNALCGQYKELQNAFYGQYRVTECILWPI
jgi:hypothetical protein